jgi:hypothetical protein
MLHQGFLTNHDLVELVSKSCTRMAFYFTCMFSSLTLEIVIDSSPVN